MIGLLTAKMDMTRFALAPDAGRPARRAPRAVAHVGRRLALVVALALGIARTAHAVSVSPNALYIDSRTRSGTLTLYNPGTLAEEIEIGFAFGYPQSDAEGNVTVSLLPEAPEGEPSAIGWMRAFPRRLRLEPGQRQVVRILVQPPTGLPDGEYWGRITITARGGQPPIEQQQGGITIALSLQTVIVAAVNYRNGSVSTGVQVKDAVARRVDGGVQLLADFVRTGNAAFLGRVRAQLLAPDGRVIAEGSEDIAVYRTLRRSVVIPLETPPAGRGYQVRFLVDTERPDLPGEGVLPANPLSGVIPLS